MQSMATVQTRCLPAVRSYCPLIGAGDDARKVFQHMQASQTQPGLSDPLKCHACADFLQTVQVQ